MEFRRFIKHACLFSLPVLLAVGFPLIVLWCSGELVSLEARVAKLSNSNERSILVSQSYALRGGNLQLTLFQSRSPDIISIGNSRVLQMREEFFRPEYGFFNAFDLGLGLVPLVWDGEFWHYVDANRNPKLIILMLDQSYFREGISFESATPDNESQPSSKYLYAIRNLYLDYFAGKFGIRELFLAWHISPSIGINALINNEGTRHDGSYRNGKIIKDPENPDLPGYQFAEARQRIASGTNLFEYDTEISDESLNRLRQFLEEAKRRNIHVVGYLPPYAPSIYELMISMDHHYSYIARIEEPTRRLFNEYGYTFFDWSDPDTLGAPDAEFLDGFHASEKVYVRLLLQMAVSDSALSRYLDIEKLEILMLQSKRNLELFELSS